MDAVLSPSKTGVLTYVEQDGLDFAFAFAYAVA